MGYHHSASEPHEVCVLGASTTTTPSPMSSNPSARPRVLECAGLCEDKIHPSLLSGSAVTVHDEMLLPIRRDHHYLLDTMLGSRLLRLAYEYLFAQPVLQMPVFWSYPTPPPTPTLSEPFTVAAQAASKEAPGLAVIFPPTPPISPRLNPLSSFPARANVETLIPSIGPIIIVTDYEPDAPLGNEALSSYEQMRVAMQHNEGRARLWRCWTRRGVSWGGEETDDAGAVEAMLEKEREMMAMVVVEVQVELKIELEIEFMRKDSDFLSEEDDDDDEGSSDEESDEEFDSDDDSDDDEEEEEEGEESDDDEDGLLIVFG